MNRTILLSVRPEHAVKILNGKKTLEIRKSVPKDYVGWVYLYCTKGKPYITQQSTAQFTIRDTKDFTNLINGKIVARFWFDEFEKYTWFDGYGFSDGHGRYGAQKENGLIENIVDKLCLDEVEGIDEYGQGKDLFVWHIKKLEIFNKPKDLWDFHTRHDMLFLGRTMAKKVFQFESVNKAPQSWQYVWEKE